MHVPLGACLVNFSEPLPGRLARDSQCGGDLLPRVASRSRETHPLPEHRLDASRAIDNLANDRQRIVESLPHLDIQTYGPIRCHHANCKVTLTCCQGILTSLAHFAKVSRTARGDTTAETSSRLQVRYSHASDVRSSANMGQWAGRHSSSGVTTSFKSSRLLEEWPTRRGACESTDASRSVVSAPGTMLISRGRPSSSNT